MTAPPDPLPIRFMPSGRGEHLWCGLVVGRFRNAAKPDRRLSNVSKTDRVVRVDKTPADLLTPAQAAARLGISVKTLFGHVTDGTIGYVNPGRGKVRPRKMFAPSDLDAFIAARTRKDLPCPSGATRAPRSGNTISRSTIVAFSARPNARTKGKRRR
jgi:hypothetical protein